MSDKAPEYSVIITCYYEERSIDEFHAQLSKTLENLGQSYEIIFINDGSTDGTFEKLRTIYDRDPHVSVIADLFRNAGQAGAITAGITLAKGKNFVFMDSDLQLDPKDLPSLVNEFGKGIDVISGCRKNRRDSLFRKIPSKIANIIVRKVSGHNITDFGCTFKVCNGKLIRGFEFGPYKPFQTAYVYSRAQTIKEVPITHKHRKYGKSGWTFRKLFAFHVDNLMGASERPFQILAAISLFLSFLFLMRLLLAWVLPFSFLEEVTPGLILNTIIFSFLAMLAVLSLVGEYVIRNFIHLQRYPRYIFRHVLRKSEGEASN